MVLNRSSMSDADHSIVAGAQAQLNKCALRLAAMSMEMALARQIHEYDSDRRKQALAVAMKVFLDQGESAAAAECKARAGDFYANKLSELGEQFKASQETIERYTATKILWQSAQSLLAMERTKVSML